MKGSLKTASRSGCKMVRSRVGMSPGWSLLLTALWTLYGVTGARPSITAQDGEDITLDCTFDHILEVKLHRLNITWKMQRAEGADLLVHSYYGKTDLWQGQDKAYGGRTQLYPKGIQKGNASLRLRAVRVQDEGSYFCYITSELGAWSQEISLAVLRKREMKSPIVAQLGQDVTLNCSFEVGLNRQLLNITWKKEEAEGPDLLVHSYYNGMDTLQRQEVTYRNRTQLHPERFPEGNASLTLRRVRSQDEGFYICHVKPELGRFSVRMQVTVEGIVSDQPSSVVYWVFLCLLPLAIITCIIIKKHHPSLLWKLRTFQFWPQQKQQEGRDQPESNLLTASESEKPNTLLPPPGYSLQATDLNSQPYGEVTTRCPGGSRVMEHGDTQSSSSLDRQPKEHEQQERAATDVVWEDFDMLSEGDIAELKAAVATNNPSGLASALQEVSEAIKNAKLEVAVVGETGSGKSSFVNATRGLKEQDTGAADTGVIGGIMVEPKAYSHPKHPNVTLWDLPGIGTRNCPSDTFLTQRHFRQYDLLIVISCERFTDTDTRLVEEIQMLGKRFYFVRSKVDSDVLSAQRRNGREASALQMIREDCISRLGGEKDVFLISSWDPDKFDFPHLQQTLAKEFHNHRACALQRALSKSSLPILQKIKVTL
ncbi:unnamed protein product [Lepidochelys kempii]